MLSEERIRDFAVSEKHIHRLKDIAPNGYIHISQNIPTTPEGLTIGFEVIATQLVKTRDGYKPRRTDIYRARVSPNHDLDQQYLQIFGGVLGILEESARAINSQFLSPATEEDINNAVNKNTEDNDKV